MPIATKAPTHRSSAERLRFMASLLRAGSGTQSRHTPEHEHGEDEVEAEDRERAFDDRARGRRRHAFGRRPRVVALEHRDEAYRNTKNDALDHAVDNIVTKIHARLHV